MQQTQNGFPPCNTGDKLAPRPDGRFVKGDPRINRKGRPRSFDQLRSLAQQIAHEILVAKDGTQLSVADAILRSWAKSKEPFLQNKFMEIAFGKVPDKIETTGLENKTTLILHYAHQRPDILERSRPGWQQPDEPINAVNGEGTRRPLLPDAG